MASAGPVQTLLLASRSPRRAELLARAGLPFNLVTPGPEPEGTGSPIERAIQRARDKAVLASAPRASMVLGVDTVVELDGLAFGQPASAAHAAQTLHALMGRVHLVHTAHVLKCDGRILTTVSSAAVSCTAADKAAFDTYLQSEAWRGKAGAYGIQDPGCDFMTLLHGELDAVIGLSLRAVELLLAAGQA